ELLRQTLDLGAAQEIPLDAELALLDRYLDIQRARFGDRLRVGLTVDPDARDAAVPVLLLQPLVENAIRHGLAEHVSAGRIDVEARRVGPRLIVVVNDDGAGLPGEAMPPRERVGLGNTRARLETLYGADHRFVLVNRDRGARVSIDIPFRTAAAT